MATVFDVIANSKAGRNNPFTAQVAPSDGGQFSPTYNSVDVQDLEDQLSGKDRNAAAALISLFDSYGLGSLAKNIIDFVRRGYAADTISLLLQDTDAWKQRFAGNEVRKKKGLPVLSPADYLATEASYRQVMQQYGLPPGFYDSPADFADFIGRDISPSELQGKVQVAANFVSNQTPEAKAALRQLYGVSEQDLTAYALDPDRALPLLQRQSKAVSIAAAALGHGLSANRSEAERLADLGITGEQAQQGYAQIAQMLPTLENLSDIYGGDYNQETAERDVFEGQAEATQQRNRLASRERAAFSGSSRGSVGRATANY